MIRASYRQVLRWLRGVVVVFLTLTHCYNAVRGHRTGSNTYTPVVAENGRKGFGLTGRSAGDQYHSSGTWRKYHETDAGICCITIVRNRPARLAAVAELQSA